MIKAYYNEYDKNAVEWLKQLIKDKLITDGDVDDRSITEVSPDDLKGYDRVHFFAGIGGWDLALNMVGWGDRQVMTGSCPCQSFSTAGKGAGKNDPRHLWPTMFQLIKSTKPSVVFGEQVEAAIRHGWLDDVQDDLESQNYAVAHGVIGAHSVGAPHIRQRLYWLGHSNDVQHAPHNNILTIPSEWDNPEWVYCKDDKYRPLPVGVSPLVEKFEKNNKPQSIDYLNTAEARGVRLKGYGNAIVPHVAAMFIKSYMETVNDII